MRKSWGVLGLALVLATGCCQNPGLLQKVQHSLETVQSYYSPLLEKEWQKNEKMRRAVVAADTTLLLAGELQSQWCPDKAKIEQLGLQAREAKALAETAGVKAAVVSGQ